jgi:hypothetical protein
MPEHRGITYIRVSPLGGDCPVVILMVLFVPNPNVPEDYTRSLYETASKAVCLIREMGAVPLVSMDSNCPFKSPGQFPNSRNARYLSEFLTDSQFLVFNWDPKASGFNTRIRGKEQSQLDLVIGPQSLLRRMTRLTMDSRIHLGSDHCAVDLSIAMKLGHIPVTKGRSYIKYNFSEANIAKFVEALTRVLPEWNRSVTNNRLPPVGSVEAKNLVTNRTSNLAQLIVGCAKATCEPKSGVGGTGPQDSKRVSKGVELRVRARDMARDNLQACMLASRRLVGGPTDTNVANARMELTRASAALKSELTSSQDESDTHAWAKISSTFTKNKSEFASAFKKHSLSHGRPLPTSLVVEGTDVRKPQALQTQWVKRFEPSSPPAATVEDTAFHAKVEVGVNEFSTNREFDTGGARYIPGINGPMVKKEVKAARTKGEVGKSPSDDGVLNEMLQYGGNSFCSPSCSS